MPVDNICAETELTKSVMTDKDHPLSECFKFLPTGRRLRAYKTRMG